MTRKNYETAEITPRPHATECDTEGCTVQELLAEINPQGPTSPRVLCPMHRVEFLREVTAR